MRLSAELILEYRESIKRYARFLIDENDSELGSEFAKVLGNKEQNGYDLNSIRENYITKFEEDLKKKGISRNTASRIAKNMAEEILNDVMNEIQ